ncbi:hypothetical protein [Chondromyces crocatus]|uniref:Uncharacterized protein n=1 Tax=Chondromyces crocatus TaxID=52 RepID=A0A0K1EIN0_CHOCO|nr:hypothetical protein [Chondromyces crocatus]AKT40715.1 uncharacterized protein CMC5_048710 [Chondromyces crocatus]
MLDSTRIPLLLSFVLPLAACGGGNGDAHADPLANVYGDGERLPQVLGQPSWLDPDDQDSARCSYPSDRPVRVTGVAVVAIDRYDETSQGATGNYYVQDTYAQANHEPVEGDPVPGFGMTVFNPSFSPPDLRLAEGDVVDVTGVMMEFAGPVTGRFPFCRTLPEIGGTMSFRFENAHVESTTVPLTALRGYESARPYIGMLVRLENVEIAGNPSESSGRYSAAINMGQGVEASDIVRISNELYDLKGQGPALQGSSFRAVTGVLTYFYGFRIAPRSPADFEF